MKKQANPNAVASRTLNSISRVASQETASHSVGTAAPQLDPDLPYELTGPLMNIAFFIAKYSRKCPLSTLIFPMQYSV